MKGVGIGIYGEEPPCTPRGDPCKAPLPVCSLVVYCSLFVVGGINVPKSTFVPCFFNSKHIHSYFAFELVQSALYIIIYIS